MIQTPTSRGIRRCAVAVALLACGILAPAAIADGPYEPNDSMGAATGPLIGGATYEARIERLGDTDNGIFEDVDWYTFYVSGPGTFDVEFTLLQDSPSCFGPEARLFDEGGNFLGAGQPPRTMTDHIVYTAPAAGRYFVRVRPYHIEPCTPPDTLYRLKVDAASAPPTPTDPPRTPVGTPPPSGSPTSNPPGGLITTPPGKKPVKALPLDPRVRVSRATFSRAGRLTLSGRRARGTSARRISVAVWRSGASRNKFRFTAHATSVLTWAASSRLPRRLRELSRVRVQVTYLADANYGRRVGRAFTVRKPARRR